MSTRHIKQELADQRSSPTIPNTSSRAQTISSMAETPIAHDSSVARDSPIAQDTPMELHGASPDSQATMANGSQHGHDDHDALKSLGAHSYRLIQGIQKLEQLHITTLESLPKFIVVGDQSAGKSSIVEALCDIQLPRSVGTCTRCPFSITTSAHGPSRNDGAWSCSISIQQNSYFENGHFIPFQGNGEKPHFANVTKKESLEPMLRRAQLAVLNPGANPKEFIDIDLDGAQATRQVAFSPNVVCLEIQGPDLPELSFIDLPGTINVNSEENGPEDYDLVQWIQDLVTSYIKDEKALVLLACGADNDVETSRTLKFIKDEKATDRSVGVLTKADLMPPGKTQYVRNILDAKVFALGKGWFITKQLSQEQINRGITHAAARDLEAEFFSSQPWAAGNCGIPQLQDAISRFLTEHIRGELPGMLERVENKLSQITDELALYPERPTHPTAMVIKEVTQMAASIIKNVDGDEEDNAFPEAMKAIIKDFRQLLIDVKPSLDYKTPGWRLPSISVGDSEDEPETPTPARTTMPVRPSATPTPSRKRPAMETPSRRVQRIKPDPAGPAIEKTIYTLDWLREKYERGNNSGIPETVSSRITQKLTLSALKYWTVAVERLLKKAKEEVLNSVLQVVKSQLSNRTSTQLYSKSLQILDQFVTYTMDEAGRHIDWLRRCEQAKPITFSKWGAFLKSRQNDLRLIRRTQRVNEYFETRDLAARTSTPREKRAEKAKDADWVAKTLGDDDWAEEVNIVAQIFAYYETATTCFVDTVAKSFELGVMVPLRREVADDLLVHLKTDNATTCAELLAEDPARERQRTSLLAEQAKLMEAIAELKGLQG